MAESVSGRALGSETMNIGDVRGEAWSRTSLAEMTIGAGSATERDGAQGSELHLTRKVFTETLVNVLNELREKGQLCDAVVRAGDVSFRVHRNILSTCSAYFRTVFTSKGFGSERLPQQLQEVVVSDVSAEVMECLIDYAYSRQVLLTEDNVLDLFRAADRLLMASLAMECCEFLRRRLTVENCLGIAAFARAYFRSGLEKAAQQYAYSNFSVLACRSQELLELSADAMYDLLSSDFLNVRHEEVVFETICKWIEHDPATRKADMPRMLKAVRLGFLSTKYLMERMKTHEYVCSNDEAKAIVVEALKYVCRLEMKDFMRAETSPMVKPRVPCEILFVIGGWSGGSPTDIIETYDTRADQWLVCRPPNTEPRAYHACVTMGHVIYVLGGFNGVEYFNSCRKFYPRRLQWTEAPPMNSKRCYVSAVGLQGKVYAMGGFDGFVRLNSVETLDPSTNQWSHAMPMNQQRSDAKASVLDDKIYICGGFNGQECLNTAEYFDPATNQWTLLTPMRNRRSGVGVVAYHGCLYALGGFNGITRMNSAERYDPETRMWSPIPEMYSPRSNFALGVIDELLFTIGGFNGVTTISHVECYDDTTNEWFDATGLSLYRSALSACVVKDLPNVMDFVFKPKPSMTKRKRPAAGGHDGSNTDAAGTTSTAPDGPPPTPRQPSSSVLSQLA